MGSDNDLWDDVGLYVMLFIGSIVCVPLLIALLFSYFLVAFCGVNSEYYYPIIILISCSIWLVSWVVYQI